MNRAYIGIVTQRGLQAYYREGEHTARFLIARLRRCNQPKACCVWFVMDDTFDAVLVELLAAGHADGAWAFVQDAAREFGMVLNDRNHPPRFGEVG